MRCAWLLAQGVAISKDGKFLYVSVSVTGYALGVRQRRRRQADG